MAIVTISREMGSNALPIAQAAAEELGYLLLDGAMLREVAPDYGLTEEDIDRADEKPPAFIETLDRKLLLTLHQIELIVLEQARQGNTVIYGRAGRDVLLNLENVFRVRIIAPFDLRVERLAEEEWLDPEVACNMIRRNDQQRAGFMKYYFDRDWTDPLGYDLVVNTQRLSDEVAAGMIIQGVRDAAFADTEGHSRKALEQLILRKQIQIEYLKALQEDDGLPFDIRVADDVILLCGIIRSEQQRQRALSAADRWATGFRVQDQLRIQEKRNLAN